MTKKLVIIAIATILCLSVVGGCLALYTKTANDIVIGFGSEKAVRLNISKTQDFTTNKLSPSSSSATQNIKLDVNLPTGTEVSALAGMKGLLKVTIKDSTTLDSKYYVLSGSAGASETAITSNYTQAQLTAGVELPLNNLPQYLTLTIALKSENASESGEVQSITDEEFKSASNKKVDISVSWDYIDFIPVVGHYYIVGDFCGWTVNKNAIHMNDSIPSDSSDLAQTHSVALTANERFKVCMYNGVYESGKDQGQDKDYTYYEVEWKEGTPVVGSNVSIDTSNNNNFYVTTSGNYFVCVNTKEIDDQQQHYQQQHYMYVGPASSSSSGND